MIHRKIHYGMLHVDKHPVESGHGNDLYDRRVSEANMADNRRAKQLGTEADYDEQ